MPYQFQSRIRYSEVDETGTLSLPGIVNYFQDCSTFQSGQIGLGVQALAARARAWLLVSWHIQVRRRPGLGELVAAETWPYRFQEFYGERNFRLATEAGEELASAASIWVYLNTETMRPCKVDRDVLERYQLEPSLPLGRISRKIQVPKGGEERPAIRVAPSQIDTNHHVNNGQYVRMALDCLPVGLPICQIRVEYRKAAVLGDVIVPVVSAGDGAYIVSLQAPDATSYAVVCFSMEGMVSND